MSHHLCSAERPDVDPLAPYVERVQVLCSQAPQPLEVCKSGANSSILGRHYRPVTNHSFEVMIVCWTSYFQLDLYSVQSVLAAWKGEAADGVCLPSYMRWLGSFGMMTGNYRKL